jgi:hypothetical protein
VGRAGADRTRTAEARRGLDGAEHQLHRDIAALPPPAARVDPRRSGPRGRPCPLDEQREIGAMFVAHVFVGKAVPPYNRPNDGARTRIEWRILQPHESLDG